MIQRVPMRHRLAYIALRTSLTYGFAAAVWILLSDRALSAVVTDPASIGQLQTYKGWAFVVVTTVLLYVMLRRELRRWEQEVIERKQAEAALRYQADLLD